MMMNVVRQVGLWLLLLAVPVSALAEQVHLRGSFVLIDKPEGFTESPTVPGLIWDQAEASIIAAELPADAFGPLSQRFSTGMGEIQGEEVELSEAERITIDGKPALRAKGRQRIGIGTVDKWFLLIQAPQATILITAQVPSLFATPVRIGIMDAVLASVRIAENRLDLREALPFRFSETERFQMARVLSAYAVILTDAHVVPDPADRGLFAIGTGQGADCALWQETGQQAFAERLIKNLRSVKELADIKTTPARFAESDGFQTVAYGQVNGQQALVMQTVRFNECRYARTIGIGPANAEELYRKEFVRLAEGFSWKKQD